MRSWLPLPFTRKAALPYRLGAEFMKFSQLKSSEMLGKQYQPYREMKRYDYHGMSFGRSFIMGLREELEEVAREYGARIVTPQDKIDSYMAGLRLIRGKPGCELGEAAQWQAIGYQYMKMGEFRLAAAAYQSALSALKKAPAAPDFKEEDRRRWEKELRASLASAERG